MTVYHVRIDTIGGTVMAGHWLASSPAEARQLCESSFFTPPAEDLPENVRLHVLTCQRDACAFGHTVKATKSNVDPRNASNWKA